MDKRTHKAILQWARETQKERYEEDGVTVASKWLNEGFKLMHDLSREVSGGYAAWRCQSGVYVVFQSGA